MNLPQTASTAISKELVEQYDAHEFLYKHALYGRDYLRNANREQRAYRVISGLRNPMDITVSHYFKVKSDHAGNFTHANAHKRVPSPVRKWVMKWRNKHSYRQVVGDQLDFDNWFLANYWLPYASWSILDHRKFDKVMHYENLQSDFAEALHILGITQKRPLPVGNKTAAKDKAFTEYFVTDRLRRRAKFVFGPYMKEWGYDFPESWDHIKTPALATVSYKLLNVVRRLYWKFLY